MKHENLPLGGFFNMKMYYIDLERTYSEVRSNDFSTFKVTNRVHLEPTRISSWSGAGWAHYHQLALF